MNKNEDVASARVGPATLVKLPYLGNASMIVILPTDENGDLSATLKQLKPSDINNAKFWERETQLSLPKFKLEVEYDLLEALAKLGLTNLGELDNMAERTGLQVDKAIHKAVVDVDEKGTKAAAVTGIVVVESAVMTPYVIKVDRPFAFIIKDDLSGVHLFTGRVNQL